MKFIPHLDPLVDVQLTRLEIEQAFFVGKMRRKLNCERFTEQPYGCPSLDGVDLSFADQAASCAEMLVCKWLQLSWDNALLEVEQVNGVGTTDAGPYNVRSTLRRNGKLILHDRDPDEIPVILVVGRPGEQVIRGWTLGAWGKKAVNWPGAGSRPCYMVPQEALSHPRLLKPQVRWPDLGHIGDPNPTLARRVVPERAPRPLLT